MKKLLTTILLSILFLSNVNAGKVYVNLQIGNFFQQHRPSWTAGNTIDAKVGDVVEFENKQLGGYTFYIKSTSVPSGANSWDEAVVGYFDQYIDTIQVAGKYVYNVTYS